MSTKRRQPPSQKTGSKKSDAVPAAGESNTAITRPVTLKSESVAQPGDRLAFTGFVALLVHAIIILGVSFSVYSRHKAPQTLEVTLAQHSENVAPENPDYLAQHNQEASGTLEKKAELTSDTRADFSDTDIHQVEPTPQKKSEVAQPKENVQVVSTTAKISKEIVQKKTRNETQEKKLKEGKEKQERDQSDEISSLQAKLSQQRQQYAKRPRIKTLTSVATRASSDAEYLNAWQEKVELIGNLNYPSEARKQKLYGRLRLLVSILPDGTVLKIDILESSGQRVLDDAAVRIVRLAAPFAVFPAALKKDTDQLEIIRTWKFEKGDRLISE
jgi:protein TonB